MIWVGKLPDLTEKQKMENCVFCKIIAGETPSRQLYQDEQVTAFQDIHPVAPTHVLVIPNRHIDSLNSITAEDELLLGHMFIVARQIARQEKIDASGYRLVVNTGPDSGQIVYHLHLHVIGGQHVRYPMG
jgi:histidine triad (HIT) family protein